MKTSRETLVKALRVLSREVISDDGVANACIAEAADRIEELEAEITQLKVAAHRLLDGVDEMNWQPIGTAPKDGRHILLYRPTIIFTGYHASGMWILNAPTLPVMSPAPTHWMPLPEPPGVTIKKDQPQ